MKTDQIFGKYSWNQTPFEKKLLKVFNWFYDFVPVLDPLDFKGKYRRKCWSDMFSAFKRLFKVWPNFLPILPDRLQPKSIYGDNEINYSYPYNVAIRKEVVTRFEDCGWKVSWESLEKGTDSIRLKKDNEKIKVLLRFSYYTDGSTCQRIKIGSQMVEEEIYDIVCNEAVAEMQAQNAAT